VDPTAATKAFFEKVKAGKTEEAYNSSAFGFQAQQSRKFFESALAETGLNKIESVEYQTPEFEDEGRTAKIQAEFAITGGAKVPQVITLTRESSGWKVFAIKSPRDAATGIVQNRFSMLGRAPDFVAAVDRQPTPDEASMKTLVTETLLRFDQAVKERNFVPFFVKCSLAWQDQLVSGEYKPGIPRTMRVELTDMDRETGASRLHRAFQPFMDKDVDLSGVAKKEPIFTSEPMVSTDGLLIAAGYYNTEPYKVIFSMKFMYELPKWKLFGLDVSLRK
jgi:hypothetical protein